MPKVVRVALVLWILCFTSSCGILPLNPKYQSPPQRPPNFEQYYAHPPYTSFREEAIRDKVHFAVKRIFVETPTGEIKIDYYYKPERNKDLVFVFPLLGGKNHIADYFAEYFVRHGFDSAVVHRNNDFKNPVFFDKIEEVLRENVVRDRVAIDFFEKEYGKAAFGSFGISRGAINVATTAGVDPRLKYNVMALGGTDMVDIFKHSNQKRLKFYRNAVMQSKGITKEDFYKLLRQTVKTAPEHMARYIDAKQTLLLLSAFDRTVPFKFGMRLREQIGEPKTVVMAADHYTSILYTQYVSLAPPFRAIGVFPFDYIESEALGFYRQSFGVKTPTLKLLPFRLLQIPFSLIAQTTAKFSRQGK